MNQRLFTVALASMVAIVAVNAVSHCEAMYEPLAVTRVNNLEITGTTDATGEVLARAGLRITTPATGPTIKTITSDPNGAVTEPRGSLRVRTDAAAATIYQNTDSVQAWFDLTAAFTSTAKGLAPASGGGTTNFLRADGTWESPPASGFGSMSTGADGSLTFDGTSVVAGLTPAANTYTLTDDLMPSAITVDNGVTLRLVGYRILCRGVVTNNGVISHDGGVASGSTGGGGATTGLYAAGGAGVNGTAGTGAGSANIANLLRMAPWVNATPVLAGGAIASNGTAGDVTGRGGSGGGSSNAVGGSVGTMTRTINTLGTATLTHLINGYAPSNAATPTKWTWTAAGGSGGGTAGCLGGGSGGGAGIVFVTGSDILGSGVLRAKGGAGGNGLDCNPNFSGGGGGGGGGLVMVIGKRGTGATWTTDVTGGAKGLKGAVGAGDGGDGHVGFAFELTP